ncbi:glycoside hydrolase family 6 protein [Streptomyces fragilis]|uniref:Glucanase n=1 Tax=Streptomyces fragilis TaxID=67301 RepID=A0ABV2YEA7_9ACTN|nr:glycoside hydrolase family 6 protein [Streptomyces fragilis]
MLAAWAGVAAVALTAGLVAQAASDTPAPAADGRADAVAAPAPSPGKRGASPSAPPQIASTSSPRPEPSPSPKAADDGRLYLHPDSQVGDWVRQNPGDRRSAVIARRIASRPAAVWFADPNVTTVTGHVRAVTSRAAAQGRVPVLVAYTVPGRDCGQYSAGGAQDLDAYGTWIDRFAAGIGSGEVIVILEPDSIAQSHCLSESDRKDRFAALARAGRVVKRLAPRARVYYDAGHSGWNPAAQQAALLRRAGAASPQSSDGIFSNVSNFRTTADEVRYVRAVLDAMDAPASHGAVIDTSRNGNGPPPGGVWCDPPGRKVGRAPALSPGEARVDAYLWVKLPGESDGCRGRAGAFTPDYAYELAR